MPITRRELVSLLPAALLLSTIAPELSGAEGDDTPSNPLPSAFYPFASLAVQQSSNVVMRHILKGGRCSASSASPCSFGNVAHSRRHSGDHH